MNIVFWLIVIVALVLLWFCLSFAFKGIGAFSLRIYNDAKKEISEESEEKSEKTTEALRIAAEAETEANRMIAGSLTGELIEKIKYEQWNGELPTVTGSSSIISIEP